MRIVTLEEHVLTPAFARAVRHLPGRPAAALLARMEPFLLDMGEGRLAAMDAAGIEMQVLSLAANGLEQLPPDEAAELVRDANNRIAAAVRAHPDRFAGFATLALADIESALAELHRARTVLGFAGVMLHGMAEGVFLDDEPFAPLWAAAEALDMPVYLYPAPPPAPVTQAYYSGLPANMGNLIAIAAWGWHAETGLHVLRLIVSGLFDRHPGLRVIVGHMGENLPFSIDRAAGALALMTSHLRRPVAEYFHRHFWMTTSGYFTADSFHRALDVAGIDRIVFSVDYPFRSAERGRALLDSFGLEGEALAKLAHRNADALLAFTSANI